jgi:DNA modification methylase
MTVYEDPAVQLLQGDVMDQLKALPDGIAQTCVTSPPYWGLRQYLFDGAVILRRDLDRTTKERIAQEMENLGIRARL